MPWAIQFDYPEAVSPLYAGEYKGALGWAPTLATAYRFETQEAAERVLANYGSSAEYGRVIECLAM